MSSFWAHHWSRIAVALPLVLVALAAVAPGIQRAQAAAPSKTVTFALLPGDTPTYIFPLTPAADFNGADEFELQYQMWRPLYWFGDHGRPVWNSSLSLAYAPKYSNDGKTVTIRLKSYRWSDGQPVTTRDVQFWMNLLIADKTDWGAYTPGDFLDNLTNITYSSPTQFSMTFTHAYNQYWFLYNELSQIYPIPQQSWDRESASGPVGNFDLTTSGAVDVYNFLNRESSSLSTWDTNPLWQVVDGPWRLQPNNGFAPSTGYTVLVRNLSYSGTATGNVAKLEEIPFTSESAEFDALRAGQLDYGYLPLSDLSQRGLLHSKNLQFEPWVQYGMSFLGYNFTNPKTGPIFKQLYVRQAMQSLVNQAEFIKDIMHGQGWPTYGPVPVRPDNPFDSAAERHNPYPYSLGHARALLRDHGWKVVANGVDVCQRAGSGSSDCGPGVRRGTRMDFTLQYASGEVITSQEVQALQSSFSEVGISVTPVAASLDTVFGDYAQCDPSTHSGCSWDLNDFDTGMSTLYYPDYFPTGGENFSTGGGFNGGGYSNPTNNANVVATHDQAGLSALTRYQDYLERQLPVMWLPGAPAVLSEISGHLHGANVQDPYGNIYPQNWTVS